MGSESQSGQPKPPQVGEQVQLRKPHACGGFVWRVARVGADIGLDCATCGRRILLGREEFLRRLAPRRGD